VTKVINVGGVLIGGENPIKIQSMTNTKTSDIQGSIDQILALQKSGCEIVRLSAPDELSAQAFSQIKPHVNIPLVADIHFDYRLAIMSIEHGADKIRINPGNIGSYDKVKKVIDAAKAHNVPIRVGVNSGSIEKGIMKKYGYSAKGLALSGLNNTKMIEDMGFNDIVISVKSSSVFKTIEANRLLAKAVDYPLHIGVTEAGVYENSIIKSAGAFAPLLMDGIGDTIRVSITGDPVSEIHAAKKILTLFGVRKFGVEVVSCPTCARTCINVETLARSIEEACKNINKNIKIAVMGCVVNGPGEAKDADIGVAGGNGEGLIFLKGQKLKKVKQENLLAELKHQIEINF